MLHTLFPYNYDITINPELPGDGNWKLPEVFVPGGFRPAPNKTHLILKVVAGKRREIWHLDMDETTGMWTTPDPYRLLLLSSDSAIYVDVDKPTESIVIDRLNLHITPVEELDLILLNDYFGIYALGKSGLQWKAPYLFFDDMSIRNVAGNRITCRGTSLNNIDEETTIVLDITNGEVLESTEAQAAISSNQGVGSWLKRITKRRER